tara:strand:+ start:2814 stop:3719 length:906 start_codon:yes stop_codon:yes gene_type:complete
MKYLLLWCIGFFLSFASLAAKPHKLLVVNSNYAIEKYQQAQDAFIQQLGYQPLILNLGEEQLTFHQIKEYFYRHYPDAIYAIGTKAYLASYRFVPEKDIVYSSIVNWRRLPRTDKYSGVANELHGGYQLVLLKRTIPDVEKLGVIYSPKYNMHQLAQYREAAKLTEHQLHEIQVEAGQDVSRIIKPSLDIDLLILLSDPVVMKNHSQVLQLMTAADKMALPVVGFFPALLEHGALMVMVVDNPTIGRQAAQLVQQIQENTLLTPKNEFPAGSHVLLNQQKAKKLGITIAPAALDDISQMVE